MLKDKPRPTPNMPLAVQVVLAFVLIVGGFTLFVTLAGGIIGDLGR